MNTDFTSNELTQDPLEGHTAFELRCAKAEIGRLRAALERAERVSAMVNALPVTTEELRRIRNAGKITWDKMVNLLTSCLIDMREASTSSPDETFGKEPWRISLPKITPELADEYSGNLKLIETAPGFGPSWTQDAVDFACMLQGERQSALKASEPHRHYTVTKEEQTELDRTAATERCERKLQYPGGESRCVRNAGHDGNCLY